MGLGPIRNGKQGVITPYKGSWAQQEAERKFAHGGKPYNEQLALARRWDKCVDAGSPLSAQLRS